MVIISKPHRVKWQKFQGFHFLMDTFIWQNFNKIHRGQVGRIRWFHIEWSYHVQEIIIIIIIIIIKFIKYLDVKTNLLRRISYIEAKTFLQIQNLEGKTLLLLHWLQTFPTLFNKGYISWHLILFWRTIKLKK